MKTRRQRVTIAAYLRVSTKKQADSQLGIEAQERYINNWINYNYNKKEYDVQITYFKDEGISGATQNRQEFQKMLQLIEQNFFDICVIYKIDRLTRDVGIASEIKSKIAKSSCSLISISENFDLETVEGEFVYNIQSVFGEHERAVIRKRTIDSQISKLLRKEYPFRMVYGYKRVNGKTVVDDQEAKIVKAIFEMFNQTKSFEKTSQAILIQFNHKCNYNKIKKTLKKIEYTGKVCKQGVIYDDIFPEIISNQLYDTTQKLLNKLLKVKRVEKYIYENRVMCSRCNCYARKRSTIKKKSIRYYYYQCTSCKKYINVEKVKQQIKRILILKDFFNQNQELKKIYTQKIKYFNQRKKYYTNLFVLEQLTVEEYRIIMDTINNNVAYLQEELIASNINNYSLSDDYHQKLLIEKYVDKIIIDFTYKILEKITFFDDIK